MFTDLGRLGHGLEGLGAHVLGVRRGVADPVHSLDCSDVAEQVTEQGTGATVGCPTITTPERIALIGVALAAIESPAGEREVAAIAVDVLTEEGDLADAVGGEMGGLTIEEKGREGGDGELKGLMATLSSQLREEKAKTGGK